MSVMPTMIWYQLMYKPKPDDEWSNYLTYGLGDRADLIKKRDKLKADGYKVRILIHKVEEVTWGLG